LKALADPGSEEPSWLEQHWKGVIIAGLVALGVAGGIGVFMFISTFKPHRENHGHL
jgi:hypothetical protein